MAEGKELNLEELQAASGGWNFEKLSAEDQKRCMELWQDRFDAGGTNLEEACNRDWEEFDAYLCRKYGVEHDDWYDQLS